MALESLLQFRGIDSTSDINARLSGLIPKGIVKGGLVIPEPNSLQVRITGDGVSPFILLAFAYDGMVVRELNDEHILAVNAGITSVIVLRAKYVESLGGTIARFEVIPLGAFETDPDPTSLIRLCSVSPPATATAVLSQDINMSYRDSIEGFTRRIVRDVVGTKEDLPAVSGFPAIAEINFLGNDFALGSVIDIGTGVGVVAFPIVSAIDFPIADPSVPGLSRVNPSQKTIVAATQSPISGVVTVVTSTPHGFIAGQQVRISGSSAPQANQLWTLVTPPTALNFTADPATNICTANSHGFATGLKVQVSTTGTLPGGLSPATNYYIIVLSPNTFKFSDTLADAEAAIGVIDITTAGTGSQSVLPQSDTAFFFSAALTVSWTGTGGVVVDTITDATVVVKAAAGVIFSLLASDQFTITGATDSTFNGLFTVVTVIDTQTLVYNQAGYPTSNSGNGNLTKQGIILPANAIEIGESATVTALNFETAFNASQLAPDIKSTAIGSSLQFMATTSGVIGNSYTLSKVEPGILPANQLIVLSGPTFTGGVDPNPTTSSSSLEAGDLYVVMYGESGTLEIWGYDGIIFRNLTSASTATLLDFHRRNQFLNEKHLTENQVAALIGTVGVPSGTNKYVTQEDTSVLTTDLSAALTGADGVAPSANNRYLTEARKRGERGSVKVPPGQDWVEVPLGEGIYDFTPVDVNTVTSTITIGTNSLVASNSGVFITTGALPAGLMLGTLYYVINPTANTIQVSLSPGGSAVTLGDGGSGFHSFGAGETWTLVVGADNLAMESSYAIPYFNLVFTKTLYDPITKTDRGGPTEYSQIDFTPVTVSKIYVAGLGDTIPPFPPVPTGQYAELNPSLVADSSGIFPRSDALLLALPTRLFVQFNQIPDNTDTATLLFSKVVTERYRKPSADMLAMPQRILPAQVQDLINRTKELRFNAGISVSGTVVTFPANLFSASNVQDYLLTRVVGSKPTSLTSSFSIDFATGAVTGSVDAVTLVPFAGVTLNKWTKYLLRLTPQGVIEVQHIAAILEKSTDLAYASSLAAVAEPSLPFSDGSFVFASICVQSNGIAGTTILNLAATNLNLFPYQGTNSKDYLAPITCGDGTSSFGHFSGTDSHIRAMAWATSGSTIKLGAGTYYHTLFVTEDDITLDGSAGAVLSAVLSTAIVVTGKRFTAKNLSFINCNVAIDLQGGADHADLSGMIFDTGSVTVNIKAPSIYTFGPANVQVNPINIITLGSHSLVSGAAGVFTTTGTLPSGLTLGATYYVINPTATTIQVATVPNGVALSLTSGGSGSHSFGNGKLLQLDAEAKFNKWVVSDGTNGVSLLLPDRGVGDFNSPKGIQQAHDAANSGDVIYILPGVYSIVIVTKDRIQFKGLGGGEVRINGAASSNPCIAITGSYNQFDNIVLENSAVGIDCPLGATFNTFSPTVIFSSDINLAIKMPQTDTVRHYNYHPFVNKNTVNDVFYSASVTPQNAEVTIGDGVTSWGDYVGGDAIQVAINNESEGTKLIVRPGSYNAFTLNRNNFVIEGSGAKSIITAVAPTNPACITVVNVPPVSGGEGNVISGFYLVAESNLTNGLTTVGISVTGDDNHFENIKFESVGANRIEPNKKYLVTSGFRNRFVPHTGAPTGYVSWTVGDGVHSFGDFNGTGGITQAINALPTQPSGTAGVLSAAAGSTVTFSDPSLSFELRDLYRYVCIQAGINAGSFKITSIPVIGGSSAVLTRTDGLTFSNETGVYWGFVAGAKIWVLAGQYDAFTIPNYQNDIDIEAWGAGHDTMIVGDPLVSPLLELDGNRCRIKGFRFVGGIPITGVAVNITGENNVFEANRYETANRFTFGAYAVGNQIYDAPEAVDRTYLTVATQPSRGDFVGTSDVVIQAAVDEASIDSTINRVILGEGTWTLTTTIYLPANVTLEGSGYGTELVGTGAFPALMLTSGGHQTIKGIRFNNFNHSLTAAAPVSGVFAYGNWLESAPIDAINVTGSVTMNL